MLLDEVPTPGTATEGRFDINAGDRVNIGGEVRHADAAPLGVTANLPVGVDTYIYATSLTKV